MPLKTPEAMLKIKHEAQIDREEEKKQKLNLTAVYFLV